MATTQKELYTRFTHHEPKDDQPARYERLRYCGLQMAQLIEEVVPESREKSLAFTHLENAIMWANAGIARRM